LKIYPAPRTSGRRTADHREIRLRPGSPAGHRGRVLIRRETTRALMHAVLGAADALGGALAALLGDPAYYRRFGFELSTAYQITPPTPEWQPHFQVRILSVYQPRLRGMFTYPEPFDRT
jgi:predicted N-acetyltransferase YhbS